MTKTPLLPSDYYLMQALAEAGVEIAEDDWREFKAEVRIRALEGPQPAVVAEVVAVLAIISAVASLISIGLTIVAQFFKPKPGNPARLEGKDSLGTTINSQRRYAPRSGFDAVQEPAAIGSVIPLVYALREPYGDGVYGGIRINMPLVWSQIQSFGGSQLLRAIFLLSEGRVASLDVRNFAIGNNAISSYDLLSNEANQLAARLSVYFRSNGGRILSADRILGRSAGLDQGNAENGGGQDVFATRRAQDWFQDFSCSVRPNTQTKFGLFNLIGNNLGFRVNPSLSPGVQPNLVPTGKAKRGASKVKCTIDDVAQAKRDKYRRTFSSRSGLISGFVGAVGSSITYRLDNTSDAGTIFSTVLSESGWQVSVGIADIVGPQLRNVSESTLTSFVNRGSLGIDTEAEKLRLQVVFNAALATRELGPILTENGTFSVSYEVTFTAVTGVSRDAEELTGIYDVTINKSSTSSLREVSPGSYTPPQLIDNGDGTYSLTASSAVSATYELLTTSVFSFDPLDTTFEFDYLKSRPAIEKCGDVAAAVAGRQKSWDDAIIIGDLYKIGSALAICTARTPSEELFESEQDFLPLVAGAGQAIEATFTTVRPGFAQLTDLSTLRTNGNDQQQPQRFTATNYSHLYRLALASVSTQRACHTVEIGLRSNLGIRIGGLCNFSDTLTYADIDGRACNDFQDKVIQRGQILRVQSFQSGAVSISEERYSFFRISYRESGTSNSFVNLSPCFGVRSVTQQNCYNYIRFRMPEERQWEFRFEPLSGWEIRSGAVSGSLEILDAKLSSVRTVLDGLVAVTFNGVQVDRNKETFALNNSRREQEIGIGFTDDDNYVDAWGKLAEAFVYEEVQASGSGPEHEIVYINEIVPNDVIPKYDNLAIVGINVKSSIEFQQFAQFSAYVTGGIACRRLLLSNSLGPSHLFPDVLLDLMTNPRYGRGDLISDELIDFDSFLASAQWCNSRGYFFDGAIVGRENLRQWAADVAATHLLIFGEANGRFFLRPAFQIGTVQVKGLFTAGNIREESFKMQYLDAEERQPIQVSIRYREERGSSNLTNPGVFPVEREILVREASVPDTAPIESIDVSDYATNPQHAIDAAKFVSKFRRLSTHGIRFETTYEGVLVGLAPGDFIRVAMDTNVYDEFNNGIVTPDGSLISTQTLGAGSYSVFAWNGDNGSTPGPATLNVAADGQKATPTGIVFTVIRSSRQVQTYQVESIEPSEEGYLAIEAVHMPTNESGALVLADGLFSNVGWVIQR